jgi:hypothetical protein
MSERPNPQAEALKRLRAALTEARAIYDARDETPAGESGPIAGVVNTVHALVDYLREIEIPTDERGPLLVLEAAFRDHARGKPHPLFAMTKKRGRRGHSTDNTWHATVAAAVTLLQKAGEKKPRPIATVADRIGVKRATVRTWHREISAERHADDATITIYKNTLADAAETHPDSPALAAEQLLAARPSLKL